jgi:hypothetical protein
LLHFQVIFASLSMHTLEWTELAGGGGGGRGEGGGGVLASSVRIRRVVDHHRQQQQNEEEHDQQQWPVVLVVSACKLGEWARNFHLNVHTILQLYYNFITVFNEIF